MKTKMESLLTKIQFYGKNIWTLENYQRILVPIARICILGLFIDDGIRVAVQWKDQHMFISSAWANSSNWVPAHGLIAFSVLGQIAPCIAILLFRRAALPSCILLATVIIYHSILYHYHLDMRYLAVNFSILGGLCLLMAETQMEQQPKGEPQLIGIGISESKALSDKRSRTFLLVAGRVLIPFMFLSLLRWDPTNPLRMIELGVAFVPMFLVIIGYKARSSALVLAVWLSFVNVTLNAWWRMPANHPYREHSKFDFFQTVSVVGALLLVSAHGAGQISLDAYNKKQW